MPLSLEQRIAVAEYIKAHYIGKDKEQVKARMDERIKEFKKEQAKEQSR